jgi:hypothetical protein
MLIQNITVLLHKHLVGRLKIEIYGGNYWYLAQISEKVNFLSNEAM